MRRANRQYQVREMVCDWALDIPLGDTTVVLYFNSRNNAELVKTILEHEDAHPNEAVPFSLPQPQQRGPRPAISRTGTAVPISVMMGMTSQSINARSAHCVTPTSNGTMPRRTRRYLRTLMVICLLFPAHAAEVANTCTTKTETSRIIVGSVDRRLTGVARRRERG